MTEQHNPNPMPEMVELYARWSDDRKSASPRPLREWLTEYSSYENELLMWATEEPLLNYLETLNTNEAVEAAFVRGGENRIAEWRRNYEANLTTEEAETETNPLASPTSLTSLNDAAKQQNLRFPQLAKMMQVSLATLMKLEERQIIAESVPVPFLTRLAGTLRVALDDLRFYLQQSPQQTAGAMYNADSPPETGEKITFEAALAFDNEMTPEQKAAALSTETG